MSARHLFNTVCAAIMLALPLRIPTATAQVPLREIASRPTVPSAPGNKGLLAADYNADGKTDLVVSGHFGQYETSVISLLSPDPAGNWGVTQHWIASDGNFVALAAAGEYGGHPLFAAASVDEVRLFAYPQLRPLASWPTTGETFALAVRDIDADGDLEAVVASGQNFVVHDLWSGVVIAQVPHYANSIHVTQLDADPALEIILDGTPGRILDGATLGVDWQYAGQFFQTKVSGPILEDGGFGFVSQTTGFRVGPYSPMWTAKVEHPARAVVEIDGDAYPEILFANGTYYTPANGQIRYFSYYCANSEILVAQLLGGAAPEVACGDVGGFNEGLHVQTLDATQLWEGRAEPGFYQVANIVDADGNGQADTVWASGGNNDDGKLHFSERLGESERMQVEVTDPPPLNSIASPMTAEAVQADGDPALEYVVLARVMYTTKVFVVDGASGQVQAQNLDASGGFNRTAFFAHRYQTPAGAQRVATVFGDPESNQSFIYIGAIDPATAAVEGMTSIPAAHGRQPRATALVNVDADAVDELVVATESAVFAYDLESKTVLWSRPGGAEGVTSTTVGGETLIHLVSVAGIITQLGLNGGNVAGSFNAGPAASGLFAVPDASGLGIACANRKLVVVDLLARSVLASSRDIGARPCRYGALEFEPSGSATRFVVGGNSGVYRFEVDLQSLFGDGLEGASWHD